MIIGIDIDDTLVKTNEKALEIIERECIPGNVDYYEQLDDVSGFIRNHFKEIVQTAKLYDGAKEVITNLHGQGYQIVFVTARATLSGADTEQDTIDYLEKNGIPYDAIYMKNHDKVDVCLEEGIDVFIDDKEKTLRGLNDKGIACIKMASIDKGPSDFITVSSWAEMQDAIEKIGTNKRII